MDLSEYRKQIDEVDEQLVRLFGERMAIVRNIAAYKKENGLPVYDRNREAEKLESISNRSAAELRPYTRELWKTLYRLSRAYQKELRAEEGEDA